LIVTCSELRVEQKREEQDSKERGKKVSKKERRKVSKRKEQNFKKRGEKFQRERRKSSAKGRKKIANVEEAIIDYMNHARDSRCLISMILRSGCLSCRSLFIQGPSFTIKLQIPLEDSIVLIHHSSRSRLPLLNASRRGFRLQLSSAFKLQISISKGFEIRIEKKNGIQNLEEMSCPGPCKDRSV